MNEKNISLCTFFPVFSPVCIPEIPHIYDIVLVLLCSVGKQHEDKPVWNPLVHPQRKMSVLVAKNGIDLFWITYPTRQLGALSKRENYVNKFFVKLLVPLLVFHKEHLLSF